jgi:AsmA family protein
VGLPAPRETFTANIRQELRPARLWPRRGVHRALLGAVGFLAAVALALVIGEHHLKTPLLHLLAARAGREIRVDGAFQVHLLSRHPTLTAEDLTIDNPAWLPAGRSAALQRVSLRLAWRLALPPLEISRLEVEGAQLWLVRDASGRANWHLHESGPGKGPPLIRSLYMPQARVELHDDRRHLEFTGTVSAADEVAGTDAPPLKITAAGVLNGRPASLMLEGEPLSQARSDQPYHFTVHERSGATQLSGRGFLEQPFDFRAVQVSFSGQGPDMNEAYYLIGLKLPHTGPFHVSARLERQGQHFLYRDLTATSGESDLHGTLTVESSPEKTRVQGELQSDRLRLADLGEHAAGVNTERAETSTGQLPDTSLRSRVLLHGDWKLRFHATELDLGSQSLHSVAATLLINRGVLSIAPFSAALAQGTISGSARLDAGAAQARGELALRVADLELAQLRLKDGRPSPIEGTFNGVLELEGEGNSLHSLAAAASGKLSATVVRGEVRASLVDAASLNLTGALGGLLKRNKETALHCAVAAVEVKDGTATVQSLVLDTDEALITGSGTVQLDSQSLDLTLRGRPKHAGLALRSAVTVRGNLAHPQVGLASAPLAAQGAAAVALGVLLTPVASVLAFVTPGLRHDPQCSSLMSEAVQDPPAAARASTGNN